MNILVITDGKPGHQNQSLGIAERLPGVNVLLFKHGLRENLREALFRWGIGRTHGNIKLNIARGRLAEIVSQAELEEITKFKPYLTISTGTTSAPVNILFKRVFGIPSICIMRPSLIPLESFDMVILPAHDAAPDLPNIQRLVITPNRAYPEMAKKEAADFAGRTGNSPDRKYLGIVIGGKAKGLPFNESACLDMLGTCYRWASEHDIILLLTTSRRSGNALEDEIEKRWGGDPRTGYMLLAGRDPENPTYAFYGLAGRALITSDSMSMVSEAIYAGLKPIVADFSGGAIGRGKRGRFYDGLVGGRFIDLVGSPDDLPRVLNFSKPFAGDGVPEELKRCLKRIVSLVAERAD